MDDVAVGRGFRALRIRRGWTQRQMAAQAGIHQSTVSAVEKGRLEAVSLPTLRRLGRAVGMTVELAPRWPIADVARLLDADHASLVERVVKILRGHGWEVLLEYTFNHFGDRGSVDVLAWHRLRRALVLVEVKSRVADIQATHATLDRKSRVVPSIVARERGWRPEAVGRLLVIGETHGNRELVRRHANIFGAAFPSRTRAVRGWIRDPVGGLAGLWFLTKMAVPHQTKGRGVREARFGAS